MQMTHIALALTIALLGVTGFLAWEGQQAAKGARKELEAVKAHQAANATARPSAGDMVALPQAPAKVTPPAADGPAPAPTPVPVPVPVRGGLPGQEELMAGSGALPGGGLTVPKSVLEAEAAGINTNTLTAAQKQVLAAKPLAKVKTVVKEQGFIVIDAGSSQGVTKGMKLNVRRDNAVLGRVTVTDTVEENEAVADLDLASIPTGVVIEPGDELIQPVSR